MGHRLGGVLFLWGEKGRGRMEQRICDICKKDLADMSFIVKQSNRKIFHSWGGYSTVDVCNECGKKLIGLVNMATMPPVMPPPKDWMPNGNGNVPMPSYRPPTPPSSGSCVKGGD